MLPQVPTLRHCAWAGACCFSILAFLSIAWAVLSAAGSGAASLKSLSWLCRCWRRPRRRARQRRSRPQGEQRVVARAAHVHDPASGCWRPHADLSIYCICAVTHGAAYVRPSLGLWFMAPRHEVTGSGLVCGEVSTGAFLRCAEVCACAHVVRHACSRTHMHLAEQPGCSSAHVGSVGSPKQNKGRAYGSAAACANASTVEQYAKYFHGLTHDKLVCLFHWLVLHVPVRGLKALGLLFRASLGHSAL